MKYERKCTNCGRTDHYYAKGLCRACYDRMRKNGTFEKQYPHGIGTRPDLWSDNTKKILELYRSGMRQVDIVKEVGLTKQAVSFAIKHYATPTHADRIRSMTDAELAEFLAERATAPSCTGKCHKDYEIYGELRTFCRDYWLDWLRQEAETDG